MVGSPLISPSDSIPPFSPRLIPHTRFLPHPLSSVCFHHQLAALQGFGNFLNFQGHPGHHSLLDAAYGCQSKVEVSANRYQMVP